MDTYDSASFIDPEDELLGYDSHDTVAGTGSDHAVRTAPVFTKAALNVIGEDILPQRTLYGSVISQCAPGFPDTVTRRDAKLYINTNAPFSGVVCGVQGSGKSHSTAVLLEGCLMRDPRIGTLPAPLTGLVFHFDTAAGGGSVQPCEAAYLASLDAMRGGSGVPPAVTVLVVPNNLNRMREVYAPLPHVRVAPLHFASMDISGDRLLAMMKVDSDVQMPLYMEVIMNILRSMENFEYHAFREQLKKESQCFNPSQKSMMKLRLSLLDSCLKDGDSSNRVASQFKSGQLTIIDLSSPFMDAASACSFFDIILGLFIEYRPEVQGIIQPPPPKLVVLDEAHKYLTDNGSSSRLTDSLLSIIRQQRHENMRVLISTQEPTVVPSKFLDLCSFVIAHRFSSPQWLKHLAHHVAAADSMTDDLASKVVSLRTGEAMFFAPAGLAVKEGDIEENERIAPEVVPIGQGYFLVRSRLRITRDGGQSFLAVPKDDPVRTEDVFTPGTEISTLPTETSFVSMREESSPPTSPASSGWSETQAQLVKANGPTQGPDFEPVFTPSPVQAVASTSGTGISSAPAVKADVTNASSSPASPSSIPKSPTPIPPAKYQRLVTFLTDQYNAGRTLLKLTAIGDDRSRYPHLYSALGKGKLSVLMDQAHASDVVIFGGDRDWIRLHPKYCPTAANKPHSGTSTVTSSQPLAGTSTATKPLTASITASRSPSVSVPAKFQGLVTFLRTCHARGMDQVDYNAIGIHRSQAPKMYSELSGKVKIMAEEAKGAGLVLVGGQGTNAWMKLQERYR